VHGRFSKKAKRRGHVPRCARPRSNSTTNPQKPGSNPTAQSTGTRSLSSPHVRPADAAPRQLPPHDHPEHCSQQYPAKSEKIRTQFLQLKERGEKCRVFRLRETTMRGGLLFHHDTHIIHLGTTLFSRLKWMGRQFETQILYGNRRHGNLS
jgi:hypothetical protein